MATLPTTIKQERGRVLSTAELERKYDLASIATLKVATKQSADNLKKTNVILEEFVNKTLGSIEELQKQVDGNITTWFEAGEPTLSNKPAVEWDTDTLKANHVGDLYYDKDTGYGYRFVLSDSAYEWTKITDNDVVEALAIANAAKDVADGKRRVFTAQPIPPYDSGDLWIRDKELYVCQISKDETYVYAESDFIVATKYTDDTYAKQVNDKVVVLSGTVTEIKTGVDEWKVEVNSTFSSMDTEIKSAQTQIRANTDGINLKVDKNGVIGAINLTEETVKIAASRVELEGAVTFASLASDVSSSISESQSTADSALATAQAANSTAATALATANKNDTLLMSWCAENNKTLIDGGKIYAEDLYTIGAKIGGWNINSSGLTKLFPQTTTNTYGPEITATKPEYSNGATALINFRELSTKIYGLPSTEFDYFGTRFKNETSSNGMGIEYGDRGIGVAGSVDDITNENYELVMAFSKDNVWVKKLSTENIVCKSEAYIDKIYVNELIGCSVKSVSGVSLDTINSNLNWNIATGTNTSVYYNRTHMRIRLQKTSYSLTAGSSDRTTFLLPSNIQANADLFFQGFALTSGWQPINTIVYCNVMAGSNVIQIRTSTALSSNVLLADIQFPCEMFTIT